MSEETGTIETDNVTSTVTEETESNALEKKQFDVEPSNTKEADSKSNDLFDALKEPEICENKENEDAVDGETVSQEPMEVDENSDSQIEQNSSNENEQDSSQQEQPEQVNAENVQQNENETEDSTISKANDEQDSVEKIANSDAVTAMDVDTEPSSQEGEDVPDANTQADESTQENTVEHLNCSSIDEQPAKDRTISDDPFDSLLNASVADTSDAQNDTGQQTEENESENEDDNNDANDSHHDGTVEACDDFDEGKGADEALCLLPDEEREISDADKERAENEEQDNEANEDQENDLTENNIEENGEKEAAGIQNEDQDAGQDNEYSELNTDTAATDIAIMPHPNEIREIDTELSQEKPCLECGLVTKCKYTLLKEMPPNEDETDSVAKTELHFLCDGPCVSQFIDVNKQYKVIVKKVAIFYVIDTEQMCRSCETIKICRYRFKEHNDAESFDYICEDDCLNKFTALHLDKFVIAKRRFIVEETIAELAESEQKCFQCLENVKCKYTFKQDDESFYVCEGPCLNLLLAEQSDRFRIKRQSIRVKTFPKRTEVEATTPRETRRTQQQQQQTTGNRTKMVARTENESRMAELDREASFCRRCAQCYTEIILNDKSLQWEAMDFCNESCLGQYQSTVGAACQHCQNAVSVASMGKYCVRFGFELRQFCRSACLDAFKKDLKVCAYCQQDIPKNSAILAKVNSQYKDFCTRNCMRSYIDIFNTKKPPSKTCAVCNNTKPVRVELIIESNGHTFCSNPCFSAFKFVNNIHPDSCAMCRKYFERKSSNAHTIYHGEPPKVFCSKICMNIFIITQREISPCQWCKVRKYNFDMIHKLAGPRASMMLCSLNCLQMCEVSMNAIAMKQQKCDQCNSMGTPQYHLTMSDASMRNFCTYQCVMSFQSQFSRIPLTLDETERSQPVPTGLPKRIKSSQLQANATKNKVSPRITKVNSLNAAKQQSTSNNLVISSVTSLAPSSSSSSSSSTRNTRRSQSITNSSMGAELNRLQPVVELEPLPDNLLEKTSRPVGRPRNTPAIEPAQHASQARIEKQTQIVTVPPLPKKVSNIATMCSVATSNKEIQARPMQFTVGCQTDSWLEQKIIIPVPVPIYLPTPMNMYVQPFPVPVPIPLPIPVPIFIPTTRNSANGIMKEIKKIQDKMPADPFEAELLMMAEMVAGDKKTEEETDSSDDEGNFQNEEMSGNNFGDDMLQMALKMATEYDPHAVDLEASMQANTITPQSHPGMPGHDVMQHQPMMMMEDQRIQTRKRGRGGGAASRQPAKRQRRGAIQEPTPQPEPAREQPIEKADYNFYLKFTFGVNAWKQWVMTKNAELEKSSVRRKLFKTDLLQLTADELNYSLCLFVKEVRKPNGSEYAPDTIYYLVLGIQEYLYENGRIDNIFTDPYYERFTDCLDEVAKKFSVLYNDSQYIVTRVEEEHLWECKQLGAHSPHVLLSTLMFFNTKHFNLTTVEEHMQLSFSHIMKHWKRNPSQGSAKTPGSRNVLLRFYPPQSANMDSRKKKVYEQQEDEENPLRCPVKLYEFYLSKCPESVKTRNDVFYLLPERSCVPDSPVWYSTQALGREALSKMLHRVKMVKEINIALLTS